MIIWVFGNQTPTSTEPQSRRNCRPALYRRGNADDADDDDEDEAAALLLVGLDWANEASDDARRCTDGGR